MKQRSGFAVIHKAGIHQFTHLLGKDQMLSRTNIKSRCKELTMALCNEIRLIAERMLKADLIRSKLTKVEKMLQSKTIFQNFSVQSVLGAIRVRNRG